MDGYLPTGIPTLDTLLGGRGLPEGACLLVRGEPGSGKTTLALQIARHNLLQGAGFSVVWLSAEQPPKESLGQVLGSLWCESYADFTVTNPSFQAPDLDQWFPPWQTGGFNDFLEGLPARLPAPRPDLLVIDSLNALLSRVECSFGRELSERQALLAILALFGTLRTHTGRPNTILTAEAAGVFHGCAPESYICDVVVELSRQSVTHAVPYSYDVPTDWREWREDLLLCCVTKGRGLPIQRRPSCYEFVAGEGLKFYPTYAAQGLVSLFCENASQIEEIAVLRTVDVPSLFPGVVVQDFHRSGLQRMFGIRRYQDHIPPRYPLVLSSVDEYWLDVLRNEQLLEAIPAKELKLYSLEDTEDSVDLSKTQIITELCRAKQRLYRDSRSGAYLAVPYMANIGMLVYRRDLLEELGKPPPETWEELETICDQLRAKKLPHLLLLETRTYDTLMATALELCWTHGAVCNTNYKEGTKDLVVGYADGGFEDLLAAIVRLFSWVHDKKIVPLNSTLEPMYHSHYEWAFARHWYSTWIDVLASHDQNGEPLIRDDMSLGFCEIPLADAYRDRCGGHARCRSAWGEWYLAIQRGSENIELGIDLINNLMTSRKVTERATTGAGLPVVEQFYRTCGEDICCGTDLSYNELRRRFFADAGSRTDIADYRKVARILSGALRAVVSNPGCKVEGLLEYALREIQR